MKFKRSDDAKVKQFLEEAEESGNYPWEEPFVQLNADIKKIFSVNIPLEYFMKLEYIRQYRGEKNRNAVVLSFLLDSIDDEIARIKK